MLNIVVFLKPSQLIWSAGAAVKSRSCLANRHHYSISVFPPLEWLGIFIARLPSLSRWCALAA